jgi:hypothetical protein
MYLRIDGTEAAGGLGWYVDSTIGVTTVSQGHEELTNKAADGLVTDPALVKALLDGVRRPDMASPDHIKVGEEHRHFLRSALPETSRTAWTNSVTHLRALHRRIVAAAQWTPLQFGFIGEALHLIQDGYAPAHVERDPPAKAGSDARDSEIVHVRYHAPWPLAIAPREHAYQVDPRDNIWILGKLKPEAELAIEAGRAYLNLVLAHIRMAVPAAQIQEELNAFIFDFLRMQMPVLRIGSRGAEVSALQRRLNLWRTHTTLRLLPIRVSGSFDAQTQKAVTVFQKAMRLAADGVVGPRTWRSLPTR